MQAEICGEAMRAPDSVLTAMDLAVDLLEIPGSGQPPSSELIGAIDTLLTHVMSFRTVALPEDQTKVLSMCRVVLFKKLELAKSNSPSMNALVVGDLKIAVMEMEQLLNNCVLRLFVSCMVALDDDPLSKECALNEGDFDLLMDRLIQLGIIAIGFTESGSGECVVVWNYILISFAHNLDDKPISFARSEIESLECSRFVGVAGFASCAGRPPPQTPAAAAEATHTTIALILLSERRRTGRHLEANPCAALARRNGKAQHQYSQDYRYKGARCLSH